MEWETYTIPSTVTKILCDQNEHVPNRISDKREPGTRDPKILNFHVHIHT